MLRDLAAIDGQSFDAVVIGGGVVGAAIARDAARRGLKIALLERDDFAAATSEAMSHLVHGGIRYLPRGQVGLVRSALAERAIWRRIAPHQIEPQTFMMPLPSGQLLRTLKARLGTAAFAALGRGNEEGFEPGPLWLSARDAIAAEPVLDGKDIAGAALYRELRVDEPERVVLGLLADAVAHGAVVANHLECSGLSLRDGRVNGVVARDGIDGHVLRCSATAVINATGPGAATFASSLLPGQAGAVLQRSKGIHLIVPPLTRRHALAFSDSMGHAFIVPWKGFSLVGTTDTRLAGEPEAVRADNEDVALLLEQFRRLCRGLEIGPILSSYAAVRALPGEVADTYRAARQEAIADHADDGAAGLLSVFGGKWTSARLMAEHAVDRLGKAAGRPLKPCDTATAPLPSAPPEGVPAFLGHWQKKLPSWPADEVAAWVKAYGTDIARVLSRIVLPDRHDAAARERVRLAYAVTDEMAVTAADMARRLARWSALAAPGLADRAAAFLASGQSAFGERRA